MKKLSLMATLVAFLIAPGIARADKDDDKDDKKDIDIISEMIITTKLPQSASTYLEKILCDSDLDYLGREDFFMIAHQLQYEWNVLNIRRTTLREWYELQIMFLENHSFFTASSIRLRDEKKADNLKQVQELVCFMRNK